jgi:hypothetical protein
MNLEKRISQLKASEATILKAKQEHRKLCVEIGQDVRALRLSKTDRFGKKLQGKTIAKACGFTPTHLCYIEKGYGGAPLTERKLRKVCKEIGRFGGR